MVLATIQDLRIFQWARESVRASVVLSMGTQPTATDTFTLGSKVFTVLASGAAVDGELNRGVDLTAAKANVIAAINGTDGWNVAHSYVVADDAWVTDALTIRARVSGVAANSLASTETFTAVGNVFAAATLLGGVDPGTDTPATSKMLVANWDAEPTDQVYHPPLLRGLIQRYKGGEIVTERGTNWNIPDTPAFYQQLPNWLAMSVRGGVRPVSLGGGLYSWTYDRDPTGNPDVDCFTIERRLSDGITPVDRAAHYNFARRITFKGSQNTPVMLNIDGTGRRIKSESLTASLSAPATPTALLSSSSKVYIDTTWGALGGTQITGQILEWEVGFNTGYAPLFTTDGRSDLDFGTIALSSENTQIALRLRMLVKPLNGQFATEQAAAEASTLRAVRVECNGASGEQLQLDMMVKHNLGSLFKIGEFEGQDIVEMELVESTDASHLFRAKVINTISALI